MTALSLLFVLFFSSFTFAATSIQKDSISAIQNNVIFVSGNATIIGLENLSNANIVSLESTQRISSKSKVKTLAKTEDHSISAQIIKKETEEKEQIAKLQKQSNLNTSVAFLLLPSSSDFNSTTSQQCNNAVVCSNLYSKVKFLKSVTKDLVFQNCIVAKKKQKFCTSLSYLQFGKYRSSSLRGPPRLA